MKHAVGFQQIWVPFKARLFLAVYYQVVFVCMMMESFGYFWQRDDRSRLGGDATAYDFLDGQAAEDIQSLWVFLIIAFLKTVSKPKTMILICYY